MKKKFKQFFVLIAIFLFSCQNQQNKKNNINEQQDSIKKSISIKAIHELKSKKPTTLELFEDFFKKFKNEISFRSSRLVNPLYLYEIDDAEINSENFIKTEIGIEDILLNQKDWNEKISFKKEIVASDTINMILEGNETGLKIIHQFVIKDKKWYLNKVIDLSM